MSDSNDSGWFSRLWRREPATVRELREQAGRLKGLESRLQQPYLRTKVSGLHDLVMKLVEHNTRYQDGDETLALIRTTLEQAIKALSELLTLLESGLAEAQAQRLLTQFESAIDSMQRSFALQLERLVDERLRMLSANLETLDMLTDGGGPAPAAPFQSRKLELGQRVNLTELGEIETLTLGFSWSLGDIDRTHPFRVKAMCIPVETRAGGAIGLEPTISERNHGQDLVRVSVNLWEIADDVSPLIFALVVEDADLRGQNLGQLGELAYRVLGEADAELAHHRCAAKFGEQTALETIHLYRRNGVWRVTVKNEGYRAGLDGLRKAHPNAVL